MSIIASIIVSDAPQIDGRRAIVERHTDHAGIAHDVFYLAEHDADAAALLPTRAAQMTANEQDREVDALIAFAYAGNDPRTSPFSWVSPEVAFPALLTRSLGQSTEAVLDFAPVVAGYTLEGLQANLGVSETVAAAVLEWANKTVAARQALADAEAVRQQIAAGA